MEKAILDAIDNRPRDEDDPEEARLNQFDNLNLNMTKINVSSTIATSSETDPGKFLHYMTKSEWQTDEPTPSPTGNVMQAAQKLLPLPTRRVIISHTGGKTCNSTVKHYLEIILLWSPFCFKVDTHDFLLILKNLSKKYILCNSVNTPVYCSTI